MVASEIHRWWLKGNTPSGYSGCLYGLLLSSNHLPYQMELITRMDSQPNPWMHPCCQPHIVTTGSKRERGLWRGVGLPRWVSRWELYDSPQKEALGKLKKMTLVMSKQLKNSLSFFSSNVTSTLAFPARLTNPIVIEVLTSPAAFITGLLQPGIE